MLPMIDRVMIRAAFLNTGVDILPRCLNLSTEHLTDLGKLNLPMVIWFYLGWRQFSILPQLPP